MSLYDFISHTFTNCGATGRNGPTLAQMRSAYSGTTWVNNTEFFNSELQGYQVWTVPITGTYRIKAYGAEGGNMGAGNSQNYQGKGAWTQGDFYLTENTKLTIIVGQRGGNSTHSLYKAGGGGGATWVLKYGTSVVEDSNLYCVAGGGGGEDDLHWQGSSGAPNNENGGIVQNSLVTDWNTVQSQTGGYGGGGGASYGIDGGGGAYGTTVARYPFHSLGAIGGGKGPSFTEVGEGGFGGGGVSGDSRGGGGGGYVGGDCAQSEQEGGEGGSSRNNGSSISFGNHSYSNGSVEITFIS